MTSKAKMSSYKSIIETALKKYLPKPRSTDPAAPVQEAMRYSLLTRGKRIRPVLTLAFCELCGGELDIALPFACAAEMIHTYSLIHVDLPCMDDDDLRRGRPTNHKVYGEDIALLAGDGLLTLAFETALSGKYPAISVRAAGTLARCAGADKKGMVGGQCIDLKSEGTGVDLDLLRTMDIGKTVALISAACQMGCIAAQADETLLKAAQKYAFALGLAFQIRDDILDVIGDAAALGKNVGMDTERDKRNYVSLLGVEKAQELVDKYTKDAMRTLKAFPGDPEFLRTLTLDLAGRSS